MAKASASKKKQTAGPERARRQAEMPRRLAEIDRQIAALIQQRAEMVKAAASPATAAACASGFDDLAMARIIDEAAGPLPKTALRAVFRELLQRLPGLGAAAADRPAGAAL